MTAEKVPLFTYLRMRKCHSRPFLIYSHMYSARIVWRKVMFSVMSVILSGRVQHGSDPFPPTPCHHAWPCLLWLALLQSRCIMGCSSPTSPTITRPTLATPYIPFPKRPSSLCPVPRQSHCFMGSIGMRALGLPLKDLLVSSLFENNLPLCFRWPDEPEVTETRHHVSFVTRDLWPFTDTLLKRKAYWNSLFGTKIAPKPLTQESP